MSPATPGPTADHLQPDLGGARKATDDPFARVSSTVTKADDPTRSTVDWAAGLLVTRQGATGPPRGVVTASPRSSPSTGAEPGERVDDPRLAGVVGRRSRYSGHRGYGRMGPSVRRGHHGRWSRNP